jgi:hypothetical protein
LLVVLEVQGVLLWVSPAQLLLLPGCCLALQPAV